MRLGVDVFGRRTLLLLDGIHPTVRRHDVHWPSRSRRTEGTAMNDLSPAAQAILDAYGDFEAADTNAMAAALRAAAPQMEFVQDHLKLLAIADELDNISPPS